ncbi:MAG: [LysW]-lysine hydrolase, partial [Phycisphaerales bacterium]|nr:[LysW]-lysine hydrolase [Phycisphaerales bacterium]
MTRRESVVVGPDRESLGSHGATEAFVESKAPGAIPPAAERPAAQTSAGVIQAVDALHRLVATPSVSGSEAAAVGVFVEIAAGLGLTPSIDGAGNGLALRQSRGPERARIILLGHIDTVPGHIPVHIEDRVLHGRGSVDAKGPLSAMLVGASRASVPEGVAVEVVAAVGEETPTSPGARFVLPRRRPSACIIGEPSGWDGVTLGYKGRLRLTAEVSGGSAHSAGAGESACDAAIGWWSRVRRWVERMNDGRRGTFETISASLLAMESGDDGLRQWARVRVGLRLPVWMPPGEAESSLPALEPADALEARCRVDGAEVAHEVGRNDAVVRALSAAIRGEGGVPRPKRKSGTSDMNVVGPAWGCPIAAYGPGDSALDHTPHERVSVGEYLRSIRVL